MTVHPRLTTSRRHRPSLEIIKTDVCARERENESNRELIVRTKMISARQRKIFYVLWYFWITLRDAFHTTRRMKCSFFAYADVHTSIERSLRVAVRLLWNQWHATKLQAVVALRVLCKFFGFTLNRARRRRLGTFFFFSFCFLPRTYFMPTSTVSTLRP